MSGDNACARPDSASSRALFAPGKRPRERFSFLGKGRCVGRRAMDSNPCAGAARLGVYVPVEVAEREALAALSENLGHCADPRGFKRRVDDEIARLWQPDAAPDPDREAKVKEVDEKIAHIGRAIEDGLDDAAWANTPLQALSAERRRLTALVTSVAKPPQISIEEAMSCRRDVEKLLAHGSLAERKQLIRCHVAEMKLAPERREVEVTYRVPEPIMNNVVAGAGFEPATFGL